MSFQLGDPKQPEDIFYDRKPHVPERPADEDFQSDIAHVHKDLFETISEAHYLPELGGPHDEALLESLVEKGCEDNQILGQTLDKFAHLVHASGEYVEEEDDMLLGDAPVTDIIDRLGESLESPSRSSMTAAQGLLHLHHIGDHLAQSDHQGMEQTYMTEEVFVSAEAQSECSLETLSTTNEMQGATELNQLDYEQNAEKRLQTDGDPADAMYTEQVPDLPYNNKSTIQEERIRTLPELSEVALPSDVSNGENISSCSEAVVPKIESEDFDEGQSDESSDGGTDGVELVATDLSKKACDKKVKQKTFATIAETTNSNEDIVLEPKDLSVHQRLPTPHASPRRTEIPRAPSRESDAMQSPQPSGIPAIPSSPEIFTMPHTKSKQSLFLESLLSSPSPKMYTSEVTITKQHSEPLNLGKHRKSASPTVTSCSDEMRKLNKEFGEPQEKRRRESTEDFVKISKIFNRCEREDQVDTNPDLRLKTPEKRQKDKDELTPFQQLQLLKNNPHTVYLEPLFIPIDKMAGILKSPGREIPALFLERPELRMPEPLKHPSVLRDRNNVMMDFTQLEDILEKDLALDFLESLQKRSTQQKASSSEQADQTNRSKTPSTEVATGDADGTNAVYNQMWWVPYFSHFDAMTACSQNADFLKALSSSGYLNSYPDLSLMNPAARLGVGPSGFPMVPPVDYDSRLQIAMWQEAMNNANVSQQQRAKNNSTVEAQMREMASKSSDVQNPYVHSTKNHQSIESSNVSSRSSPMATGANYNAAAAAVVAGQRAAALQHNQFLQNMYSGINPNIRPNVPLAGLQISPYYNPNFMGRDQRSPRNSQQKSPTSPFYPNNNYLQSVQSKQFDSQMHRQRSSSTGSHQSTESPRPRISVKSLHNLLEPTATAAATGAHSSSGRRSSNPPAALGRRREETEVGSTTPLGEAPLMPPHPHDPASFHLWHPLFGNQKNYNTPWNWTTVTATGD